MTDRLCFDNSSLTSDQNNMPDIPGTVATCYKPSSGAGVVCVRTTLSLGQGMPWLGSTVGREFWVTVQLS